MTKAEFFSIDLKKKEAISEIRRIEGETINATSFLRDAEKELRSGQKDLVQSSLFCAETSICEADRRLSILRGKISEILEKRNND